MGSIDSLPAMKTNPKVIFFTDFDGTITLQDSTLHGTLEMEDGDASLTADAAHRQRSPSMDIYTFLFFVLFLFSSLTSSLTLQTDHLGFGAGERSARNTAILEGKITFRYFSLLFRLLLPRYRGCRSLFVDSGLQRWLP